MAVDFGLGKYGTTDRIPNRQTTEGYMLAMGTKDKMTNAYHPSRHLPEHLRVNSDIPPKVKPSDVGISISPLGFGNAPRGQDPMGPTGTISNSYQVSPAQKFIGDIINSLLFDNRNAAIGIGPLAGTLRGMRLLRPIEQGPELGGFRMTTQDMRREMGLPRPNMPAGSVPGQDEKVIREGYLDQLGLMNDWASGAKPLHPEGMNTPIIKQIQKGQDQLDKESMPSRFHFNREN